MSFVFFGVCCFVGIIWMIECYQVWYWGLLPIICSLILIAKQRHSEKPKLEGVK